MAANSQHDIFLPTINLEHDLDKINQTLEGSTDIPGNEATDDIEIDQTYVLENEVETENDERQNLRCSKRGHIPSWKYLARFNDQ